MHMRSHSALFSRPTSAYRLTTSRVSTVVICAQKQVLRSDSCESRKAVSVGCSSKSTDTGLCWRRIRRTLNLAREVAGFTITRRRKGWIVERKRLC